jgi:hypothetical protein
MEDRMDLLKMADQLDGLAAALRAEAARDTTTAELPLAADAFTDWPGGDEPPVEGAALVEVKLRAATAPTITAPANALTWWHYGGPHDIVAYREIAAA